MADINTIVQPAADRFFRQYARHCRAPDHDSLLDLLNAIHGLNDKLRNNTDVSLFGSAEFVALKALRNYFHHQAELVHEIRILPTHKIPAIVTDLLHICLVDRGTIEKALERVGDTDRDRVNAALNWYGPVVDIQPCLFNSAVDIYETIEGLSLNLTSEGFELFRDSYEMESEHGYSHRITGHIGCHAGNVDLLLAEAFGISRKAD